jgi:hypothetical protein
MMWRRRARLAKLTTKEEKSWEHHFRFHLSATEGKTTFLEADKKAWSEMQKEFPRLRRYCGAHP